MSTPAANDDLPHIRVRNCVCAGTNRRDVMEEEAIRTRSSEPLRPRVMRRPAREDSGEALTGARAGWAIEPRKCVHARAVQKLIAGIVEGFLDDAPFRLARSHRETRPTLGLLARISVRHRTVMASTVRHAARWPVRPLVAGNNAMPNLEDRSMASRAVWHSPLRPDHADCHRTCAHLTTAGLQVLDGWHSSRHGAHPSSILR